MMGLFYIKIICFFFFKGEPAHLPQLVRGWGTDSLTRPHHGEDRWYGRHGVFVSSFGS